MCEIVVKGFGFGIVHTKFLPKGIHKDGFSLLVNNRLSLAHLLPDFAHLSAIGLGFGVIEFLGSFEDRGECVDKGIVVFKLCFAHV